MPADSTCPSCKGLKHPTALTCLACSRKARAVRSGRPLCRHCAARVAWPDYRGLCRGCWEDMGVREQYPTRRGLDGPSSASRVCGGYRQADTPTDAQPGSEQRILAYMERAEQGMAIFHDDDAPMDLA